MRSKGAQFSIAVVCLVLGIMLAIQFKTTQSIKNDLVPARIEDLTQKLNTVTGERDVLAEEVLSLREKLKNIRENDQAMADLQEELQKANMSAGLIAVEGPGVIVTLNDSNRKLQVGENANPDLIHDYDLREVVNEIRSSGAEAISINGERLTAISEIRCAGTLILVNWTKIGPPFTIKVIGNPDMLESGLLIKGGYIDYLKAVGVQVHIQKAEQIEVPAYSGRLDFEFGKPVEYKEKAE